MAVFVSRNESSDRLLADKWNSQFRRHPNKEQFFRLRKEKELADETHRKAHYAADRWRHMWRTAGSGSELPEDIVDWHTMTWRSTLTFAACVLYGQATVAMAFPGDGEHQNMTTLYFREDSERVAQRARDTEESDEYGVSMISELMSRGNGVVAASPASYRELREEDKETIQRIIMEKLRFWGEFTKS